MLKISIFLTFIFVNDHPVTAMHAISLIYSTFYTEFSELAVYTKSHEHGKYIPRPE